MNCRRRRSNRRFVFVQFHTYTLAISPHHGDGEMVSRAHHTSSLFLNTTSHLLNSVSNSKFSPCSTVQHQLFISLHMLQLLVTDYTVVCKYTNAWLVSLHNEWQGLRTVYKNAVHNNRDHKFSDTASIRSTKRSLLYVSCVHLLCSFVVRLSVMSTAIVLRKRLHRRTVSPSKHTSNISRLHCQLPVSEYPHIYILLSQFILLTCLSSILALMVSSLNFANVYSLCTRLMID